MKIAIKNVNGIPVEFRVCEDNSELPEGFTEFWTEEAWNEHNVNVLNAINSRVPYEERMKRDKQFSRVLLDEFLLDSRIDPNITTAISLQLLQKFGAVGQLLQFYDVKGAYAIIPFIEVDAFFTQERKDKYISMIESHILYL